MVCAKWWKTNFDRKFELGFRARLGERIAVGLGALLDSRD